MPGKIIARAESLEEAIAIFSELQSKYPTRSIEVYLNGSDYNERQDDDE